MADSLHSVLLRADLNHTHGPYCVNLQLFPVNVLKPSMNIFQPNCHFFQDLYSIPSSENKEC